MISHVTIGTNDLDSAVEFYQPIFQILRLTRMPPERATPFAVWHSQNNIRPLIAITLPQDGKPHTPGNGQMLALQSPSRPLVDQVYQTAIASGATDEGLPGLRPHYHNDYYGAYFRDLDGNKICIVCHGDSGNA